MKLEQINSCRLLWTLALSLLVGCADSNPAAFRLNMAEMVEKQIAPEYQQQIADVLEAMFGTPDEPYALADTGLEVRKLKIAAGPVSSDEQGVGHGLYRQHCAHCHGITGDGRGPTAQFLNPYPRDYRQGIYKFKSTFNPARPTDDDLRRVIENGVPGTAMPAFALLPPGEIDALVEYVKYLSMRGQMESALVEYLLYDAEEDEDGNIMPLDPVNDPGLRDSISDLLVDVVAGWEEAEDNVIAPEPETLPDEDRSAEQVAMSVEQGRELFYGTKANCIKCHGPTGLGDGQQDDHNFWNKARVTFMQQTEALADTIAAGKPDDMDADEWRAMRSDLADRQAVADHMFTPRNAIPRNLRQGMYRGGRRPLDIYRKVYTGIAGTPMPGGGPATPGAQGTLTDEEMWQLVDYVRSLPFEPASQPRKLRINYETVN